MRTLLLIVDDASIQEIITEYFSKRNYQVFVCEDKDNSLEILEKNRVDLILLDVMLPKEDGFLICKAIRELYSMPIIFLTARVSEKDKLIGYSEGADDYVTKPFSLNVLYAKTEAILNRIKGINDVYEKGPVRIERNKKTVFLNGKECILAPKEYEILLFLVENEGRIYSREQLLVRFWGYDFDGNERVVDNHIRKLRKALGTYAYLIRTYVKYGWSFKMDENE